MNYSVSSSGNKGGDTEFPSVSICNMNQIEKSFLEVNPMLNEVWTRLEKVQRLNWTNQSIAEIGSLTYGDIFERSFGWEKVVDKCTYGGWRPCNDLPLHEKDLFSDVVGGAGKCYIFNPKGKIKSTGAGDTGGFTFLMNAHIGEYLDTVEEEGFHAEVHPYWIHHSGGNKIDMSPGYKYKVGVKRKIREELPIKSGGGCDPTLVENSYGAYDLGSCEHECRDRFIYDTCGCVLALPPTNIHNYTACSIKEMEVCGWLAYYTFLTREGNWNTPEHLGTHEEVLNNDTEIDEYDILKPVEDQETYAQTVTELPSTFPTASPPTTVNSAVRRGTPNCTRDCPAPCQKVWYDIVVSSSKISEHQARTLAKEQPNTTADYILRNHVLMEFYMKDMFTEVTSTTLSYGLRALLSDVGGVMCLFLGASICTFFAFFLTTRKRDVGTGICKIKTSPHNDELPSFHGHVRASMHARAAAACEGLY